MMKLNPTYELFQTLLNGIIVSMKMDKENFKRMLVELLPKPVTPGKNTIAGDPPEVVVRVSDEGVVIAPYRAEWKSPYELKVVVSDVDLVGWGDLPAEIERLRTFLSQKFDTARKTRKATLKLCSLCSKTTPPERMHDESTCQACASGKLGVVY